MSAGSQPAANSPTLNPAVPFGPLPVYKPRIGLALSGGGFRASIFHLGVIRRLEELGIMEHVRIVSSVSGGSIVAAYYLAEMEKQLRLARISADGSADQRGVDRVAIFEQIAGKFLRAVDVNMRTRALIFTPRYHPVAFLKLLLFGAFRAGARAELIQAEYDDYFFSHDTLDQLPVERPNPKDTEKPDYQRRDKEQKKCLTPEEKAREPFYGPRLVLNTTSLLTGERTTFSRDTSSGIVDLKTPDRNALKLSQVVGASSGVPVLFPPTAIYGDLLVDGGVSDNQGIEELLDGKEECDVLVVSDASGQLQSRHRMSTSEASVYLRTFSILQFQVRNKLLDRLLGWGKPCRCPDADAAADPNHAKPALPEPPPRSFAFIHLLVNLKGRRGRPPRVSTEILPALAQMRTDLDQFSLIEREALMYHGYTLIDAQLKTYCCDFLQTHAEYQHETRAPWPVPMRVPPLFSDDVQEKLAKQVVTKNNRLTWDPVRVDLEAGCQGVYILRCLKKYPWMTRVLLAGALALWLSLCWLVFGPGKAIVFALRRYLENLVSASIPGFIKTLFAWLGTMLAPVNEVREAATTLTQSAAELAAIAIAFLVTAYIAAYVLYAILHRLATQRDRLRYRKITGASYDVRWPKPKPEPTHRHDETNEEQRD